MHAVPVEQREQPSNDDECCQQPLGIVTTLTVRISHDHRGQGLGSHRIDAKQWHALAQVPFIYNLGRGTPAVTWPWHSLLASQEG